LAAGNTTGGTNLLVTVGDRIDAATAGVLSIGTVTATSVVIGASPVTITGWLNVGPTTFATASGDFSAGTTTAGGSRLEFDQSARTLTVRPVTGTDTSSFRLGAVDTRVQPGVEPERTSDSRPEGQRADSAAAGPFTSLATTETRSAAGRSSVPAEA
jgi:hypothetical protein